MVDVSIDSSTETVACEARVAESPVVALLCVRGPGDAQVYEIRAGSELLVGRRLPADVIIEDPSVSRLHARVAFSNGQLSVEDMRSRNGTLLGGRRLPPGDPQPVYPGQELAIGPATAILQLSWGGRPIDSLDGLWAALQAEAARAEATGTGLALLAIRSLDRTPASRFVGGLQSALRPLDRIAQVGRSRVLVLCPGCDRAAAQRLGHAIVAHVSQAPLGIGVAVTDRGQALQRLTACANDACARAHAAQAVVFSAPEGTRKRARPAADPADKAVENATGTPPAPVTHNPVMQALLAQARRAAQTPVSVLIVGETGAGKEVVAQHIHRSGPRADKPLVTVNCGAIADSLITSTLFGHVRGAFTGAHEARAGLFEQAHGGTLFLDEIGELSADAQVSLLRVIETGRVIRVGSTQEREVDVRVIAATHRDLAEHVRSGHFREDLLYRLNAVTLHVPPLRQRPEDIRPLCEALLCRIVERWGMEAPVLAAATYAALERYPFPGNVRELRNLLEHALVACEGAVILPEHLPECVTAAGSPTTRAAPQAADDTLPFRQRVERYEAELIKAALDACGGNQTRTSEVLQIPRRTLIHKLRAYGLRK